MNKKTKKIVRTTLWILAISCIFVGIFNNCSFGQLLDGNPAGWKPPTMTNADEVKKIGNVIIGYIQLIGSIFSVITLIVIGIKYMTGSVEDKAEYKKTMKPYIIGATIVFGITNLLGIISSIASNI